jgi:NhaP-type Na+/H+ and K+/H+ antiporter
LLTKYLSTRIALYKSSYDKKDKDIISSMISRGSGAAVVAALPLSYGIGGSGAFIDIIFAVIFVTIFINSVLVSAINKLKYKEGTVDG